MVSSFPHERRQLLDGQLVKDSLFAWKNLRWLGLAVMLAVMNQFTGINGVMYYATQILAAAGVSNVEAERR